MSGEKFCTTKLPKPGSRFGAPCFRLATHGDKCSIHSAEAVERRRARADARRAATQKAKKGTRDRALLDERLANFARTIIKKFYEHDCLGFDGDEIQDLLLEADLVEHPPKPGPECEPCEENPGDCLHPVRGVCDE